MDKDSRDGPRDAVRRLRELTSLEALVMQVGKRSKYGTRPHPSDPWGYTRQLLVKRGELDSLTDVIAAFSNFGIQDEITASKWLVVNLEKYIEERDGR